MLDQSSEAFTQIIKNKQSQFRTEIRKEKTQFSFNQKRILCMTSGNSSIFQENNNNTQFLNPSSTHETTLQKLKTFAFNLLHPRSFTDTHNNLYLTRCFLMNLYQNSEQPMCFTEIMETEIPKILLDFLKFKVNEKDFSNKIEAARSLLILTAGIDSDGEKLVKIDLDEVAMEYLDQTGIGNMELMEIILTILANLIICEKNKKKIMEGDIVRRILSFALDNDISDFGIMKSFLFLVKSVCFNSEFEDVKHLLDPIIMIGESEESEIGTECLEIVATMSDRIHVNYINSIFKQQGFVKSLSFALKSNERRIFESALKIIQSLTYGNNEQIENLFEQQIISSLIEVIYMQNIHNQRKIMNIFTNVLKEKNEHFEYFYKKGFFDIFGKILFTVAGFEMRLECLQFLFSAVYIAKNKEIIQIICNEDVLNFLIGELRNETNSIDCLIEILSFIEYLIRIWIQTEKEGKNCKILFDCVESGMLDDFEFHENNMVSNIIIRMKELFFAQKFKNN